MEQPCPICLENILHDTCTVTCFCGYITCQKCAKNCILESIKKAHCVQCKVAWDYKFLYEHFDKGWVDGSKEGQYRSHVKKISFEMEKVKLPETLATLPALKAELERYDMIKYQQDKLWKLRQEQKRIKYEIGETKQLIYDLSRNKSEKKAYKIPHFLCPCPHENCRGMIQSNNFTCVVCDKTVCRKCREVIEKPEKVSDNVSLQTKFADAKKHVCNKDVLENLKLVKADTKPCPKCAVPIFKIEGCHQMFCTQCKIVFDWKTGEENKGNIHNPHAIRWIRENGNLERDVNDVPCGGLIPIADIFRLDNLIGVKVSVYIDDTCIEAMHRRIAEIYNLIQRFTIPNNLENLRQQYVLSKITENQWKQSIFLTERKIERNTAKVQILTTFQTLAVERFRDLYETLSNLKKNNLIQKNSIIKCVILKFIKEMDKIRKFINDAFYTELTALGTKNPINISDNWRWDNL